MSAARKPGQFKAFRKALSASARRLSLSGRRKSAQMPRRRWEATRKAAALNRRFSKILDLPDVWLARRRAKKMRREEDRRHATLGAAPPPPKTLARLGRAARMRFAGVAGDRERLWRRTAGILGAVAAVSLAGNLLMYYRFTSARPLVTIGDRVIPRGQYLAALDEAAGKPVLTRIVFTELIQQAAAKAHVTPTPAQVDARLAAMARQGTSVAAGPVPAQFRDNVALGLALENLRTQGITATDAEIADFYRKNTPRIAQPARVQSILVVTRSEFEAQTAAGLLAKGLSAPEVAAQPDMHVDGENDYHLNLDALPAPLHRKILDTALAMSPGRITTLPLGGAFLTIKCLHRDAPSLPPLSQVRDQVARLVKLDKAPSADAELAQLYQANRPDFDMDHYAAYLDDVARADPSAPPPVSKAAGVH